MGRHARRKKKLKPKRGEDVDDPVSLGHFVEQLFNVFQSMDVLHGFMKGKRRLSDVSADFLSRTSSAN